ncbi:MAG TPA: NAD(P)H-binding protein [Blastocatellia bacterium]|nr:NAD(P)H-binding protein [Blastocatellia bacterium]
MISRNVFITGGTGYIGQRLIPELRKRGHTVRALVRNGSEAKLPAGAEAIIGDPLNRETFADQISPADTFVQLVGVPHPSPAKAAQFRAIDLVSIQQSVPAAVAAGVKHFVYVSVAHPAPMMKAYIEVRSEGERLIRQSGLRATILRPWYVLGPDHRWPYLLVPAYKLFEILPATRESARRLGLVTLRQMIAALAGAVDDPSDNHHVVEVPEIRRYSA